MEKIKLPFFEEEIDTKNLQDEYETAFQFNGKEIDVYLDEMQTADKDQFNVIENVLENISEFDKQNRLFLTQDFENKDGTTFEYLSYHLEELEEYFEEIIDSNDTKTENLRKIMTLLKITTINFHSDSVVFDYCLDDEISDQLLVVKMNRQKNLILSWES